MKDLTTKVRPVKEDLPATLRNDLFAPFENVFDDFFNSFFDGTTSMRDKVRAQAGYPKMNVTEYPNRLELVAAVPGIPKSGLSVEMIDDHNVEIQGRMGYEGESGTIPHVRELTQRSFTRRLRLPKHVSGDPKAVLKDGMLTLTWDLAKQDEKKRIVEILEPDFD